MCSGNMFHSLRASTEKVPSPLVLKQNWGQPGVVNQPVAKTL